MNILLQQNPVELKFSKAAATYDTAASVQDYTAHLLRGVIEQFAAQIPAAEILELGCGTGLMSAQVLDLLPEHCLRITDVSDAMLQMCRQKLQPQINSNCSRAVFELLDADRLNAKSCFGAVVCSFSLHWFEDVEKVLTSILEALVNGGYLFLAVPASGSFPEWKESCSRTGAKFTCNRLPDASYFNCLAKGRGLRHRFQTEYVQSEYTDALSFFYSLRNLGADLQLQCCDNTAADLLKVIRDLNGHNVNHFSYEVCYGYMQKI